MNTNGFEYDPSSRKAHGNPESAAAWERIREASTLACLVVLEALNCKEETCKEYAHGRGEAMHKISGRFSQLKIAGWIEPTGTRRDGSAEMRITQAGREALEKAAQRRLW